MPRPTHLRSASQPEVLPPDSPYAYMGLCLRLAVWGLFLLLGIHPASAQFNGLSGIFALNSMTFAVMPTFTIVTPGTGYASGDISTLDCPNTTIFANPGGTMPTFTYNGTTWTLTTPGIGTFIPSSGTPTQKNGTCTLTQSSTTGTGTGLSLLATFGFRSAGAPAPAPLGFTPSKVINVADYGAVLDGASHPLSAKYSTLAAAQAVCPDATALTQEQDWCAWDGAYHAALNSYDTTANSYNATLLVPRGTLYTTSSLPLVCINDPNGNYSISSITNNGGLVQITGTGFTSYTGQGNFIVSGSGNMSIDGTWTTTAVSNNTVTLNGSSFPSGYTYAGGAVGGYSDGCPSTGRSRGWFHVRFDGGIVSCATSGAACVDGMGSRRVDIQNLEIIGNCSTKEPNIGIQHGRTTAVTGADDWRWLNPKTSGCFSFTPYYNAASEDTEIIGGDFRNQDSGGSAWAAVLDGGSHWQVTSQFLNPIPIVQNAAVESFNAFTAYRTNFYPDAGNSKGLWIYGTAGVKLDQVYIVTEASSPCVTFYNDSTNVAYGFVRGFVSNAHCEGNPTSEFSVVSATAGSAPTIHGLQYDSYAENATSSIFSLGTNTASVTIDDPKIDVHLLNTSAALVDSLPAWTLVNPHVCFPNDSACTETVPVLSWTRNPDMEVDQAHEGAAWTETAGALIVDGWRYVNGTLSSDFQFQRATTSSLAAYQYALKSTSLSAVSLISTNFGIIRDVVEDPQVTFLTANWGTAAAQPISEDFCAMSTGAASYPAAFGAQISNPGANTGQRSYSFLYTLQASGVWQCFHQVIPGDTTGTGWNGNDLINHPTMMVHFDLALGGNYQAPMNNAWTAGPASGYYYGPSGATNLTDTSGTSLWITGVHLYPGQFKQPYLHRPIADELGLSDRFYEKSFLNGTAPAKNAGQSGATTFRLPYAYATNGNAGVYVPFRRRIFDNVNTSPPTMTFYSTSATTANCYNVTQSRDSGAASATYVNDTGFMLQCALVSGDALGDQLQVQWTADSGY